METKPNPPQKISGTGRYFLLYIFKMLRNQRSLLFLGSLILITLVAYRYLHLQDALLSPSINPLKERILAHGPVGKILFLLGYIAALALALPNLPFQVCAGMLFGPVQGSILMWVGANCGAVCSFYVARALGKRSVERALGTRTEMLNLLVEKHGAKGLVILRLVPFFHYSTTSIACGLTSMKISTFLLTNMFAILPLTISQVTLGYLGWEKLF